MERDNATQSHTCFLNQTKSDLLSNTECMYASAIVDTGASTSLLSMELEPTLINTQPSSARIQGFEGTSEIKGGIFGTGHMYIVSPNNQQPGFQLTTTFDTVRDLNSNLFSIAALYETHGFSILLRNSDVKGGRCEITRPTTKGKKQSIPLYYNSKKSAFMIDFIIGKDKKKVIAMGKELERRLGLSLEENISRSFGSALCPIKISKMGVILYTNTQAKVITHNVSTIETSRFQKLMEANPSNKYIPTSFDNSIRMASSSNDINIEPEFENTNMEPHSATQEEWNKHLFDETDGVILGSKAGMKSREKKMSGLELHMRHGHIGNHNGKCIVCNLLRGSFRRIYDKTSPYIERRVGHTFCGDVITWSDRSRQGNKYTMVLRDMCSGYFFLLHVARRNELTRKIEELITNIRKDPLFQELKRPIMTSLKLDPAGEWRDDNREFQAMAARREIHVTYSSPDDKRSHAHGENAVKQIEITARSILLNRALPTTFIEDAANQAAMIRNLYPLARDCVSGDGDAQRPLERITLGKISRRQIDNRLHHLIPLGTPCLIYQPKNKGSNLQIPKARWGIAIKMDGDMPIFFCPFRGTGTTFRSKNYIEYTLGLGINFYKFLGLEEPPMPSISLPSERDRNIDITTITQIDDFQDLIGSTTYGPPPIQEVRGSEHATKPLVTLTDQHGWIYDHDESGDIARTNQRLRTDIVHNGLSSPPHDTPNTIPPVDTSSQPTKIIPPQDKDPSIGKVKENFEGILAKSPHSLVDELFYKTFDGYERCVGKIIRYHPNEQLWSAKYEDGDGEDLDSQDMIELFKDQPRPTKPTSEPSKTHETTSPEPYECEEGENFLNVCDSLGIPIHLRKVYYHWIGDGYGQFGEEWDSDNPSRLGIYFNYPWGRGRKTLFRRGTRFPIPIGTSWTMVVEEETMKGRKNNAQHINVHIASKMTKRIVMSEWLKETFRKEGTTGRRPKATRDITNKDTGKIDPPHTLREIFDRPDKALWEEAVNKELDALDNLGVLSHDHRMAEIRSLGISASAVPMQLLFDVKYHPDGSLDKYKVREVVQGHKGYMRRGEHFFNTFSASPSCRTTRLLQALTIGTKLVRHAWDICTTYLWAEVRPDERIPIRYPNDLRRYDPETKEELYAILKKNCYGMPQADRRYTQLRNKFILEEFNKGGWKCSKSRQDPCLFIFTSPKGKRSFVIIHTDDCDGHGELLGDLKYIANKFHERFKIKVCDPKFMLGIQRDITTEKGITRMNMTQADFIKTTYLTFKDQCPTRDIHTPFPPGMVLHGLLEEHDEEKSKELIKRGYQSLAGSILWAARNCYPEVSLGANMVCRLMSRPTELAWKCALHTLKYLYSQMHRGIQFRSDGNQQPICYYDASNKADPCDGKSQYGYVIYLYNGPIVWSSKKHNHVGLSSTHNEYMSLSQASKDVEWIRQILIEIGYPLKKQSATPMLGDNDNATLYAREDLITPGNKFIIQDYHYAKECVERGITCPRRVDTKANISDILTKSVARPIHDKLSPLLCGLGEILDRPPDPPKD